MKLLSSASVLPVAHFCFILIFIFFVSSVGESRAQNPTTDPSEVAPRGPMKSLAKTPSRGCNLEASGQARSFAVKALASRKPRPSSSSAIYPTSGMRALNSIFQQWGIQAPPNSWNISGELCNGTALSQDDTVFEDPSNNRAIRCDCTFDNGTTCHISRLKVIALNIRGVMPEELLAFKFLTYLNLQQNYFTGTLPAWIGNLSTLQSLSIAYNAFSGPIPKELGNLKELTVLILPGLNCLQRSFPCNRNPPLYANFSIKCGGLETTADGIKYEADNSFLGTASFNVIGSEKWAVSIVGSFSDRSNQIYVQNRQNTSAQMRNTNSPQLYQTSRISPGSLRYYGLGLENGPYTVNLLFAETAFKDQSTQTWESLGRRVFDIYIQVNVQIAFVDHFIQVLNGTIILKDFDISKEAGGVDRAITKNFNATVTENYLEIHLFWAGKGTCCIPEQGYYGSSISAINVVSNLTPSGIPPRTAKENRIGLIVAVAVPVGVVTFTLILIFGVFYLRRRKDDGEDDLLGIGPRPNTFSYAELRGATDDFSPSNKLGEGGFGPVYKGKLSDGRVVAVKQLSVASHQGNNQFVTEIATISAVQHRNLVKLYGCCIEGNRRLLVYEYLENKSLDQALFGNKDLHLDWPTRFSICLATARGLVYLHEESWPRIVHRDVKASNILLDAELCPKISDFGLAKLYDDKKTHISTRVAGTIGYLAPEYAMRGHLTEKADVFGFGVVALEIVSGRPNSDNSQDKDKIYLLEWAWTLYESNESLGLVDPTLVKFDENEALRMIRVGLLCTQASPMMRPPMSRVVAMLAGDIEVSPVASKPSYLTDWDFQDITTSSMAENTQSTGSEHSNKHENNLNSEIKPVPSPLNMTEFSDVIGEGR
ncbi:hypothetical protein SLEP1_g51485 [Rubroshorea leprosula]|uniref:non-specific serine/threonine protein kinase n=1 Tax=Rubroshorea leprosula TaxID=152421 RepID=A0AAV5M457_9ROSI|nr:hypothetical protein SLEP1_g51485 [Rubroshorea leprosula]